MVRELVIYIHGVDPSRAGNTHETDYAALHDGIRERNPDFPADYLGLEWGNGPATGHGHQLLTRAQDSLGAGLETAVGTPWDFTLNPARALVSALRPLVFYGFGDVFYYVSHEGKRSVRSSVAQAIATAVADDPAPVSLTLLGHSAGSMVAFDFLYALHVPGHTFLEEGDTASAAVAALRARVDAGTLRIRRLYTFGSPIASTACRSNAVLAILAAGDRLDPADYGLTRNPPACGPALLGPRWINMWDRDDAIAWPVEPLMTPSDAVQDQYTDVSDSVTVAHMAYWRHRAVHGAIAESW